MAFALALILQSVAQTISDPSDVLKPDESQTPSLLLKGFQSQFGEVDLNRDGKVRREHACMDSM